MQPWWWCEWGVMLLCLPGSARLLLSWGRGWALLFWPGSSCDVVSKVRQAEANKELCCTTGSVLPGLGREEKALGKVRGKPFLLSSSQREIAEPACCASQADSSGRWTGCVLDLVAAPLWGLALHRPLGHCCAGSCVCQALISWWKGKLCKAYFCKYSVKQLASKDWSGSATAEQACFNLSDWLNVGYSEVYHFSALVKWARFFELDRCVLHSWLAKWTEVKVKCEMVFASRTCKVQSEIWKYVYKETGAFSGPHWLVSLWWSSL